MSSTPDDNASVATTAAWSEFFSTTAISLPVSLSDATTRIHQNLTHFKLNYAHITLTIFFISLFFHPLSLLILFLVSLAWHFLFFSRRRDDPFLFYGFTIGDQVIAAVLGVITIIALIYASVWMNLFVSICVSAFFVLFHAVIRDESPYGGLLDAEAAGYNAF